MKILIAGDTHGDYEHVSYLFRMAREHGAKKIFVVGDFGYWEHTSWGVRYLDVIDQLAGEYGDEITLYFLRGNHDKMSMLLKLYDKPSNIDDEGFIIIRHPSVRFARDGHIWAWGNTRFIALGGAYSTDKYYRLARESKDAEDIRDAIRRYTTEAQFNELAIAEDFRETQWFPEEEMTDADMEAILEKTGQQNHRPYGWAVVDVVLCHDKPRASRPDWNRKNEPSCLPNQDRIQRAVLALRPPRLIHGHLHYRYTDTIRCGDDDLWTTVDGLDCNTRDAEDRIYGSVGRPPDPLDSWLILDV